MKTNGAGVFGSKMKVAMVLAASACACATGCDGAPAPARAPSPSRVARGPEPVPPADVPALGARFFADGLTRTFETDDAGRITRMQTRRSNAVAAVPEGVSFTAHALTWMHTYGDALGYGRLGAPRSEGEVPGSAQGLARVILDFPDAEGCPGLVAALSYSTGTPRFNYFEELLCPSAPGAAETIAHHRDDPRSAPEPTSPVAAPPPPPVTPPEEPLALWLRSQGYQTASVVRNASSLTVTLAQKPADPAVSRRAFAARFARDIARAAALPALDHTDETAFNVPTHRLRGLTLRFASPPLDGACIDPAVSVELGEPFGTATEATYWPATVTVTCEHELTGGLQPPADAARTLPRTARRALPFLAACSSVNFAWGDHRGGRVIDKKGDVYTYSGGRTSTAKSVRELAVLLRHAKTYVGTLPPEDVDRLAELATKIEGEPLVKKTVQVADRGGGGCRLFKGGGPGELGAVELDSYGADHESVRTGPVSAEIAKLLGRASTLVQRGH